jgi:hypothetical protein
MKRKIDDFDHATSSPLEPTDFRQLLLQRRIAHLAHLIEELRELETLHEQLRQSIQASSRPRGRYLVAAHRQTGGLSSEIRRAQA